MTAPLRVLSLGAGKPSWRRMSFDERLWERIAPEPNTGHWFWLGAKSANGYGQIVVDGKQRGVHCVVYELWIGRIPEGMEIDHLCRLRHCVSPDHLEAVPHPINVIRGASPSARQSQSGFCVRGHPMTAENREPGHRRCRVCNRVAVSVRLRQQTTHCPQGHAYDATNTRVDSIGRRRCRICLPLKAS